MLAALLFDLRGRLRQETLARIAQSYAPTVAEDYRQAEAEAFERDLDYIELGIEELLHEPAEVLEETALLALELPGVKGVVPYDADASLITSFSIEEHEAPSPDDFDAARSAPHARFHEPATLAILLPAGENAEAGFLLLLADGNAHAAERNALNASLLRQGLFALSGGGGLIGVVFFAFLRRLRRSQDTLAERSEKLAEANRRLAQACKSAGIGAVTAHLMHALQNPLAGLKQYAREKSDETGDEEDARLLHETTNRMQSLVEETLSTLHETEAEEASYAFTASEILQLLKQRLKAEAEKAEISLKVSDAGDAEIDNLRANLILPILLNLAQNALEATPKGGTVTLQVDEKENFIEFRVADTGSGVHEHLRENLFRPVQSEKPAGSGVGLAISRELAERIDAELTLEHTGPDGSRFLLRIKEGDAS